MTSTANRLGIALALIACAFPNGWAQTKSPNPSIEQNQNSSKTDKAHKPEEPAHESDDVSPPSALGVTGAFTNNGTRAGAGR